MANPFNQLKDLISALEDDFEKSYEKHNAAAGTRVRKGMQELKNMAQQIRLDVQNQKNSSKDGAAAPAADKKAAPAAKKAAPAAAKKAAPAAKKK
jgi:membrane protease subunit (stomatin/prohibitin family)